MCVCVCVCIVIDFHLSWFVVAAAAHAQLRYRVSFHLNRCDHGQKFALPDLNSFQLACIHNLKAIRKECTESCANQWRHHIKCFAAHTKHSLPCAQFVELHRAFWSTRATQTTTIANDITNNTHKMRCLHNKIIRLFRFVKQFHKNNNIFSSHFHMKSIEVGRIYTNDCQGYWSM